MSNKILIVEDDTILLESLQDLLEENGYGVKISTNSDDAVNLTYKEKFDLYLLDINIPFVSGIELLKSLRDANDKTPAVFLTSHTDKGKLKEGFLSGGDDYITKPFDNDELLLRIKAILNRTKPSMLKAGNLELNEENKQIYLNSNPLSLSKREYELLRLLMKNYKNTVPKELILYELWKYEDGGSEGAIRVYINRLKSVIGEEKIQNIRGIGYRLV